MFLTIQNIAPHTGFKHVVRYRETDHSVVFFIVMSTVQLELLYTVDARNYPQLKAI